jgi:hypothetical protein
MDGILSVYLSLMTFLEFSGYGSVFGRKVCGLWC